MNWKTTHVSLLHRLRDDSDQRAWCEFDHTYGDLIVRYCRARGVPFADAEDLRQVVMGKLLSAFKSFEYSETKGRFRHYLQTSIRRAMIRRAETVRRRSSDMPVTEEIESDEDGDAVFEREWRAHHMRRAMRRVRQTFEPRSLIVFDLLLRGMPVSQVAAEVGVSEPAVYKIKERLHKRLREIIAEQVATEEWSR